VTSRWRRERGQTAFRWKVAATIPIHGKVGTIHAKHEFELIEVTNKQIER
jgi:hypothetical protein